VDRAQCREGIELFNRAAFFDAHEALEDVWRSAPAADKKFLQGLIQVAVALYHHGGINSELLLSSISAWQRALDEGTPVPPLPRIVLRE
jgi:predicted metal-dependent hydrolase